MNEFDLSMVTLYNCNDYQNQCLERLLSGRFIYERLEEVLFVSMVCRVEILLGS